MIEIPEAQILSTQMGETLHGRTVTKVVAAASPHGFAFYTGDPAEYPGKLEGKSVGSAIALAGHACLEIGDMLLSFSDGVNLRLYSPEDKRSIKHQLLIEFDDGCAIICTLSMYGGLSCYKDGLTDNFYFNVTKEKPSPLTDDFTGEYFETLFADANKKLSVKAFLATEQRIPGLGNGVLQDILYNAALHPRKKLSDLSESQLEGLYISTVSTLRAMTDQHGRDTEKDLYGNFGGYSTILSKNTVNTTCRRCGGLIQKESYLGGSVYFCEGCQEK